MVLPPPAVQEGRLIEMFRVFCRASSAVMIILCALQFRVTWHGEALSHGLQLTFIGLTAGYCLVSAIEMRK